MEGEEGWRGEQGTGGGTGLGNDLEVEFPAISPLLRPFLLGPLGTPAGAGELP